MASSNDLPLSISHALSSSLTNERAWDVERREHEPGIRIVLLMRGGNEPCGMVVGVGLRNSEGKEGMN